MRTVKFLFRSTPLLVFEGRIVFIFYFSHSAFQGFYTVALLYICPNNWLFSVFPWHVLPFHGLDVLLSFNRPFMYANPGGWGCLCFRYEDLVFLFVLVLGSFQSSHKSGFTIQYLVMMFLWVSWNSLLHWSLQFFVVTCVFLAIVLACLLAIL